MALIRDAFWTAIARVVGHETCPTRPRNVAELENPYENHLHKLQADILGRTHTSGSFHDPPPHPFAKANGYPPNRDTPMKKPKIKVTMPVSQYAWRLLKLEANIIGRPPSWLIKREIRRSISRLVADHKTIVKGLI